MDYICPYCGGPVNKDNILFVSNGSAVYRDTVRFNFLKHCCDDWPFEQGDEFHGLYFRPADAEVISRDEASQMPLTIRASLRDGLTPRELREDSQLDFTPEEKPDAILPVILGTRACPHCHCRLPVSFGVVETVYVTMLGGRAAGKTAFLISLIHQLNTQLLARGLGSVELEEESKIYYDYLNGYYQEHEGVTLPTPKDNSLFPFVFSYTNLNSDPVKKCNIVIYDMAGEGASVPEYLLQHLGIRQAKTVMLILDVNMTCHGAYYDAFQHYIKQKSAGTPEGLTAQPAMGLQHDFFADTVEQFLSMAVVKHSHLGILSQVKHIIAITTKIDQPLVTNPAMFHGNCILKKDLGHDHEGALDLSVLEQLKRDVNIFYASANQNPSAHTLTSVIENAFAQNSSEKVDVNALAVSTYTRRDAGDPNTIVFDNGYQTYFRKHRIIEPFLLLLYQAGMIVAKTSRPAPQAAPQKQPPKKNDKKDGKKGWFRRK